MQYHSVEDMHGVSKSQDQRSEPEAESQAQSTSDDVLHAVSIPAYETHRWKEDSCSPNLDGDLAQGTKKNLTARPQPCVASVFLAKSVRCPFGVTVPAFALQPWKPTENHDRNSTKGLLS